MTARGTVKDGHFPQSGTEGVIIPPHGLGFAVQIHQGQLWIRQWHPIIQFTVLMTILGIVVCLDVGKGRARLQPQRRGALTIKRHWFVHAGNGTRFQQPSLEIGQDVVFHKGVKQCQKAVIGNQLIRQVFLSRFATTTVAFTTQGLWWNLQILEAPLTKGTHNRRIASLQQTDGCFAKVVPVLVVRNAKFPAHRNGKPRRVGFLAGRITGFRIAFPQLGGVLYPVCRGSQRRNAGCVRQVGLVVVRFGRLFVDKRLYSQHSLVVVGDTVHVAILGHDTAFPFGQPTKG